MITAQQLVETYSLLPHPEGGYYRETYRSEGTIPAEALPGFNGSRHYATAIFFLLEQGNFSAFHRIRSDECWHFYAGQTMYVHVLHPSGQLETVLLGNDMQSGTRFQYTVPAGCWFASETAPGSSFAFVGCTVSPGFDFADFELAHAAELAGIYPDHADLINRLCLQ
ncbi:cupin domain-containing protein [Sediminibacterium ginsengisoli]|nr:cupin domain-containing protein [Sediminibacterium ginsengisoli]